MQSLIIFFLGCPFGKRVDRQGPVHGGCVQQRAAGHRREHFAGRGFLQQGEVCLRQGSAWKSGRLGSRESSSTTNCPEQLIFMYLHTLSRKERQLLFFLIILRVRRVLFVPESFQSPQNLWACSAVVGKAFTCNPSVGLWYLPHLW